MVDAKKGGRPYLIFFGMICLVFIGLLLFVYNTTRKSPPVMLDTQGRVVESR